MAMNRMKQNVPIWLACVFFCVYAMFASAVFFMYGLPSLEERIPQQLFADSLTYETAAQVFGVEDELISIGGNYLGPLMVLKLLDSNRVLIHLFNLSIVLLSGMVAFKFLPLRRGLFILGICSSPLLFFSMMAVNKEVFLLPFSIMLFIYMQRRTVIWLLFALVLALFVRWQIVFFVFLIVVMNGRLNFLRQRRWLALLALTAAISVAYPIMLSIGFDTIEQVSIEGTEEENTSGASGTYGMMQAIQRSGGYILVVVPKILQLLLGLLARFGMGSIEDDFWNNFVIMGQCLHNFVLLSLAVAYKRLKISEDAFYLMCCFAIMFALTPIFAPRYFYPLAVWLALLLASRNSGPAQGLPAPAIASGKIQATQ